MGDCELADAFRRRALAAGLVAGALALAGLLVMRHSGLNMTHSVALVLVCVSAVAGLATMLLCWRYRFELARVTAALAVAAVVVGWAAGQAPRFLPGLTVVQAAASRSTLVALVIAVACGAVVLIPSLALLFTLYLRGRLYTPEHREGREAAVDARERADEAPKGAVRAREGAVGPVTTSSTVRGWGGAAGIGLVAGAGLLVFADASWAHLLGVACLVVCAVSVFRLSATD